MAVRVYLAMSLDGFIAGEGNDLSWLPQEGPAEPTGEALTYEAFMGQVGALLMGRTTFDVVRGFGGDWPYGETPVLVATRRPLPEDAPETVHSVSGEIEELLRTAAARAGGRDVYLDGGTLVRQALSAGLVDELVLTVVPEILGTGVALFAADTGRSSWRFREGGRLGGLVQLRAVRRS